MRRTRTRLRTLAGSRRARAAGCAARWSAAGRLLAGCGGAAPRRRPAPRPPAGVGTVTIAPDGVQEITLQTEDDYVFTPDHFTVAPGKVRLTVENVAKQPTHNFRFTAEHRARRAIDAEIPLLAPGEKKTIDFTVDDAGRLPVRVQLPRAARAGRHHDGRG